MHTNSGISIMRSTWLCALFVTTLACPLFTAPAQAQRDRVFVASYGSDSNPCTFGSPCKTFQNAVNVVAAGGEVTAIDSAGFGPVIITQSVSITSPNGVEAGIAAVAGGTAITINASGSFVSLHGLTLEGAGSGAYGIILQNAGKVDIADCVIRDYMTDGILVETSDSVEVTVTNTHISGNDNGVYLTTPGAGLIYATLDHLVVTDNTSGVYSTPEAQPIFLTIVNSDFSHNNVGVAVGGGPAGDVNNANLYNVVFNDNNEAVYLNDYSTVALSHVSDADSASGSLYFFGSTGVIVTSDDTNHVNLAGPHAPGSLGSYPFK
jgi:hypothetical protein